jgi:pepF/M3 family oligoendopeptidase
LQKSKFLLGEKEELIISKMQNTGSKAWERFYMDLISRTTVNVDIDGKDESFTLSELRNLAYMKENSIRKSAYLGEAHLCKSISQACANSINAISGESLTICEMRGYESPLEKVLIDSRMDIETLNVMMKAIRESLPIFHRYFRKKAELLGHKTKLPFYDIFAPIGDSDVKIPYSKAISIIETSFKTFNIKLSDFSKKVFDNQWVDAEPRKDKGNYGLSVDIFPLQESRIITCYNEKYIDIGILAHEIGHAYHSANLYKQTMLNTDYPTPIAETASIFCETILQNELIKVMPIKEAKVILERSISDAAYYIVDFYGRYLFEIELYNRRKMGSLSVEELNDLMVESMKKAYGDGIDAETIHPYMWMNKVGYFMSGNEFLNFPYSFGVLFSKGLYAEYKSKGQTFVNQYDYFLSETSVNNIVDIAKILEVDVHSIEFWEKSLKLIESDIEKLICIE